MPQIAQDIEMDEDGDVVFDATGDLKLATAEQTVIQDVEFRIRTKHLDFGPDPYIGANLDSFRGRGNTRPVGRLIKEACYYSLIKDGRFGRSQIFCDAIPAGHESVGVFVFVQDYVQGMEERSHGRRGPLVVAFNVSTEEDEITRITDVKE
jgi:hypothetical protein